jgi:hypothetical protein
MKRLYFNPFSERQKSLHLLQLSAFGLANDGTTLVFVGNR